VEIFGRRGMTTYRPSVIKTLHEAIEATTEARGEALPGGEDADPVKWNEFDEAIDSLKKALEVVRKKGEGNEARGHAAKAHDLIDKLCATYAHGPMAPVMYKALNLAADAARTE
jgi:hypothetical protein